MATARLSDSDRSNIVWTLELVINKSLNSKSFPVKKNKLMEWGIKQLPKPIKKAYILLREDCPELTRKASGYDCGFTIRTDTHQYKIKFGESGTKFPLEGLLILPNDKYHTQIIEWAVWFNEISEKVEEANKYINNLVYACTSVGQLKRLLPQEVMRFIPTHLCDFSEVERRSRIPASFMPEQEKLDNMLQMLTVGSISPDQRKGISVNVELVTEIDKEG